MQLQPGETEEFYAVWLPLLRWVNQQRKVVPRELTVVPGDAADLLAVREVLWADDSLLDRFLATNPCALSAEQLALARSWKARVRGTFYVLRGLQKYTVVLDDSGRGKAYAVLGLRTPIVEMVPRLPCLVEGTLLPFGDRIIFDGLLQSYNMYLGPGIRRRLAGVYRAAKAGLVTSLGAPKAPGVPLTSPAALPAPPKPARARRAPAKARPPSKPVKELVHPGRCEGCGELFSKRSIGLHVERCDKLFAKAPRVGVQTVHRLVVEPRRAPMYWLQLGVTATTTLAQIDALLRDLWLECCGHLSAFTIGGVSFASSPDPEAMSWSGASERSMKVAVGKLLGLGSWRYEYDYGSTTELVLRPAGSRAAPVGPGGVHLLARNTPPVWPCITCGAPATAICTECAWESSGWLCDRCQRKHPHGEDSSLPVVNSPRTGVCGYSG